MANKDAVVKALIEAAKTAQGPEELSRERVGQEFVDEAREAFGAWETALAAGLIESVSSRRGRANRRGPSMEEVERKVTDAFEHPLYVETADGKLYAFPGPELEVGEEPQNIDGEGLAEAVRAVHYVGDSDAVYLFSSEGRFFGVDRRMIPDWERRGERRSIRDTLFLTQGEEIRAVEKRRKLATGRMIHITRDGKGKASDASELGSGLDRSGRTAFKVREGDVPVAVLGVPKETTIFCASALGKGIHFEASEIRSMGLAAVGVNVMKLADEDDAVVDAFEGRLARQVAVITEEGLGKRVDFSDFRTQGRNGAGMQLARLNPGDKIAGAVSCNPAEDVVVTTNWGRLWRLPAALFPMMGRPAKGDRMVEVEEGERIIDLEAVPCGG